MRLALAALAAAFSALATAEEPISLEQVAERYFSSKSYCDKGKRSSRLPGQSGMAAFGFERCARRDGRFKNVETSPGSPVITWSDGVRYYRYLPYNRRYQALSLDDPMTGNRYSNRAETYPVFIFEQLTSEVYRFRDRTARADYLKSFSRNAALSNAEQTVFERFPAANQGERWWVRNADEVIIRSEVLYGGVVMGTTEMERVEFDRPLSDADLGTDVPLLAPFSLMNNAPVFIAGLILASGLLGLPVWALAFARADPDSVDAKRHLVWKLHLWIYGTVAALLGILALITGFGGGGHPPAIFFVLAMAVWAAVAFAMTALFTLASYPAQRLVGKR